MQVGTNKDAREKKSLSILNRSQDFIAGFLVLIFGAAWIIGLFDKVIMPVIVSSGVELLVPDFREMPVKQAGKVCSETGLELIRKKVRIDKNYSPGTVLDQFPIAGAVVKPGRRIEVVLSIHEQMLLCPDIVGRSPREAILVADSTGLVINESRTTYQHSNFTPEGVVMSQSPTAMTGLNRGDSLKITVSLGPEPANIVAPDLVGRNIDEINFLLHKNRLRRGEITRFPDKTKREGTVLSQNPVAGTPLNRYDRVNIQIAITPENIKKQ